MAVTARDAGGGLRPRGLLGASGLKFALRPGAPWLYYRRQEYFRGSEALIPYKDLFVRLEKAGIAYLVAGGFAVNFHQVQRATVDLDLIVHLDRRNVEQFVGLVEQLGFRPRLPVAALEFADPAIRATWIKERGLKVFSFIQPGNPFEVVDVFAEEPRPFHEMAARSISVRAFGAEIKVVGLDDLIAMKTAAGRDKDRFDVEQLRKKSQGK